MAKKEDHRHARSDLKSLLAERDQENAVLRTQLQARIEHSGHLEARLLTTLDTLDEIQAATTLEYRQLQQENARLARRIQAATALAKLAHEEKEEMNAAVLQLIARVESTGDYANWHTARLELSRKLSIRPHESRKPPLDPLSAKPAVTNRDECNCPQSYSHSVVKELTDLLAQEKKSHARTAAEAERRLVALEARLAVREMEIVQRIAMCKCMPTRIEVPGQIEVLSGEDRRRIASHTAVLNKVLGSEIYSLKQEQEQQLMDYDAARPAQPDSHQSPTLVDPNRAGAYLPPSALSALSEQMHQLRGALSDLNAEKDMLGQLLQDEVAHLQNGEHRTVQQESTDTRRLSDDEDFKSVLLVEEECIRLMRLEDAHRNEITALRNREAELLDQNNRLTEELAIIRGNALLERPKPADTVLDPLSPGLEHRSFSSTSSAIDMAFPPLQPICAPQNGASSQNAVIQMPPTQLFSRSSTPSSSSSSSDLPTPTSPADPRVVPLPNTPPFVDTEIVGGQALGDASPETGEARTTETNGGRAESIARELAETQAEADARDREIAELQEAIANLQQVVLPTRERDGEDY